MFRLKKIIPCVLLSACVASSVCIMSACNSGTDYSEDITKLQQQIDSLKNENSTLKNQISNLTPSDKDYTEEIDELKAQLATLKAKNESNLSEINKLETQLANLKTSNESNLTEIENLEQQIETLKTQNTQLTEQANNQQLLIESLQNAVNVEPKIYKVGETFTYSYQGVDFFSVKVDVNPENNWWRLTIRNINMNSNCDYVGYYFINKNNNVWSRFKVSDTINDEKSRDMRLVDDNCTKLFVGFPLQDSTILPYAIFDLTSSV